MTRVRFAALDQKAAIADPGSLTLRQIVHAV